MRLDHGTELLLVKLGLHLLHEYHFLVQVFIQTAFFIQYISDAAAHTCRKVFSGRSQYNHMTTSHILAAMLSDSFYNSSCTGIADTEPFSCHTCDISFPACCAVKGNVADNNIFFRFKFRFFLSKDCQLAAGKSLAEIVVAVTAQR